jgi:hypothetical protein
MLQKIKKFAEENMFIEKSYFCFVLFLPDLSEMHCNAFQLCANFHNKNDFY